jgi:hypothetical protein
VEEEEMEPEKSEEPPQPSLILDILIESMKTCQKHSFAFCLRILTSLMEKSLLTPAQFAELLAQVNETSEVIEHRKGLPS